MKLFALICLLTQKYRKFPNEHKKKNEILQSKSAFSKNHRDVPATVLPCTFSYKKSNYYAVQNFRVQIFQSSQFFEILLSKDRNYFK